MKKLIFTLALLMQTAVLFAFNNAAMVRAAANNVKMYRQAGTSTEVVKSLQSTDNLVVVRKHNANWTIVKVDDKVGYVLTSELVPATQPGKVLVAKRTQK
jgi:uncharacterized protein YgiM (DUF1202 family)